MLSSTSSTTTIPSSSSSNTRSGSVYSTVARLGLGTPLTIASVSESASESAPQQPAKLVAAWKQFIAGGAGGVLLVLTGHPLDTIKVRLQTTTAYTGLVDCAVKTVRAEGVTGLYRGMSAPLLGVTPIFSLCFWAYGLGLKMQTDAREPTLLHVFNAGCLSGVATTAIMTPGERIKCLLQVQGQKTTAGTTNASYSGPMDVIRKVYATQGIRGIYAGTAATLARDVPGSAVYFVVYEALKRSLSPAADPVTGQRVLSPAAVLFAGGFAGVMNWVVALPADVIKSRIQAAPAGTYSGLVDCFQRTVRAEGYGALFRGWQPVMARAFPANAMCFLGYEITMKFLNWISP